MRGKIHVKNRGGRNRKIKIRRGEKRKKVRVRYLVAALVMAGAALMPAVQTRAESCPSLRIVFARGSGGERWNDQNYLAWKEAIESKLATVDLDYEFVDLDYPAVGVGVDNLAVTAGAYYGSGDAYEFGRSVDTGVKNLNKIVNGASCPGTKYVLGGYSQGAMVVSKSLRGLKADRVIYAATFGDPKLYLPEGAGVMPAACRGENLSDYRMYVPDCQAYKGLLGSYIPYEPEAFVGKVGTWCNKRDVFCSSHLNITDHVSYVAENLYEDASRVVFDKITTAFGLENHISSPHDTAILIDSTGSMMGMIEKYKAEAMRLATKTLNSGGRVALFDYRDLDDPYDLVQHCDFEHCDLATLQRELDGIQAYGGGDGPESLLSASFHAMAGLRWRQGATKSLVILTDSNFLSPDRDGMTFDEVVTLSKKIDPVNFYIITDSKFADDYTELARRTDGKVVTNFGELSLLTDHIMQRYDSLPRVEEDAPRELPVVEVTEVARKSDSEVTVRFTNTGTQTLVVLNDYVLGATSETEVTINGLDGNNVITLVPLGDDVRGEGVNVEVNSGMGATGLADSAGVVDAAGMMDAAGVVDTDAPKAPATGRR